MSDTNRCRQSATSINVRLDDHCELDFSLEGGMFHGLTAARIGGVAMIAPENSRLPIIETRDNWSVPGYRFAGVKEDGAAVIIECDVLGVKSGMGRKTDVFEVPFVTTPRRKPVVIGKMRWRFEPKSATIGTAGVRQQAYVGFDYQFAFDLKHPFHWILDSGTWEVGGDPEGVNLLSQHMAPIGGPMEFTVSRKGSTYTSAETFAKGSSNNADVIPDVPTDPAMGYIIPIQAQLRGAGGAIVDVQYKGDDVLLCYYETPEYYRTVVEWRPEDPGIGHIDHHFFSLTTSYAMPKKTVLAAKVRGLKRAGAINLWTDAWEHVATLWRKKVGVSRIDPTNGFGLDCCGALYKHYGAGPADVFERWEKRFESIAKLGYEVFGIGGIGEHRGDEMPYRSNMCQPYDYSVAARYGGPERFKQFCDRAHAAGLKVSLWFAAHLSDFAPALKANPQWEIQYDSGMPWDGAYRTIKSCSFRRGFTEWLIGQFKELKKLGLDRLFLDSYHNLGAMPIDYAREDLGTQIKEMWDMQRQCEEIGLPMTIESVGPIGITACGLWPAHLKSPEMAYWACYGCSLSEFQNGGVSPETYFRMIANKVAIGVGVLEQSNDPYAGEVVLPAEIAAINRLYRDVREIMQVRTLHDDGSVEWQNPASGQRVLFAAGDDTVTVPEGFIAEPVYAATQPLTAGRHPKTRLAAFKLRRK